MAFATAVALLCMLCCVAIGGLLFIPGASSGKRIPAHETLEAAFCYTLIALPMLANAAAFVLAVTCLVKRVSGVPWLVLMMSGLGICYSGMVAYWAIFGLL